MNEWNKLSMKDRAAYIKLGIDNGITDLATIRDTYNKFAEGGYYDNKTIEVTLPEIVVTPSEVQKEYKLKVRPFLDKKAALDIGKSFDQLPKQYFDSRMKAFIDIHEYAGKPHLKGIQNPILPITTNSGKPRAYYNPVFNTAYNINSLRDAMEEMSHPIQLKLSKKPTAEIFDYVKDVVTGKQLESYNKKGSLEYNTHRIVQPLLNKYLLQKYKKKNRNIGTLEDLLTQGYNKFDKGGYVREQNNNPIAFDEEGNLIDQVTGEKGTMMLPNFNVYGSKEVADRVAQRRLDNLINHSEINPFTGEKRIIGLESTYPEFDLLSLRGGSSLFKKPSSPQIRLDVQKSLNKSDIFQRLKDKLFFNEKLDLDDAITLGKKEASDYSNSIGRDKLYNEFIQEAKDKGFIDKTFVPERYNPKVDYPTINKTKLDSGTSGQYSYYENIMDIDPKQATYFTPYHEYLHYNRVGNPMPYIFDSRYLPLKKILNSDDIVAANRAYNSIIQLQNNYNGLENLYWKKAKDALIQDAEEYIRQPWELAVTGRTTGRQLNIPQFAEYIGNDKIDDVINRAIKENSWMRRVKHNTPEEKETFWKLLTGNYIPAVTGIGVGLNTYNYGNK